MVCYSLASNAWENKIPASLPYTKNIEEGKHTLQALPKVLQRTLKEGRYNALQIGNLPQPEPELMTIRQKEHEYLDGLLNLEHCAKIDITKRGRETTKLWELTQQSLGL